MECTYRAHYFLLLAETAVFGAMLFDTSLWFVARCVVDYVHERGQDEGHREKQCKQEPDQEISTEREG